MKPYKLNLFNSITLIVVASWGFWEVYNPEADKIQFTPLIPLIVGVILLLLNSGLKKENKIIAHIVVVLTFLIFLGLFKPLMSQIQDNDCMGIFRISIMLFSSLLTLCIFIKSFIDARQSK
tara:strand:+ start:910 stop:1272 length:363 start_codon:yes stop_codon:yes gene_type:complete